MESEAVRDNNHSLVEAIKKKYEDNHTGDEDSFIQIYVPKKGPGAQAHGEGSQEYQVPPRLALDNCGVTEAGPGEQIESLCSHVKELDMSKNRVTNWLQVFQIIQNIPLLHFLNLSFNPLDSASFPIDLNTTFEGITVLILNGAGISWVTVERVLNCFPRLTELHLSLNNYETVELPASTCHNSLTKLFINGCKLSQWSDVTKLDRCFPSLEFLNMINSDIQHLEEDCIVDAFPALKNLNISGNPLESWEEIDKFRKFPALENLRIADVPFLEELVEKERRQHLVSRLPSVKCLNGSRIGGVEREDAERAFIRAFMSKHVKPPRYYELEAVYGKLDPLVHVDLTPQNIIQLVVKFGDKSELMDIDTRLTVLELKKLLRNVTGLPPSGIRIFHREEHDGDYSSFTEELKLNNAKVYSYNIKEGDVLIVKFEEKVELMDIDKRQTVLEFKKLLRNFTGLPAQKFRLMHVENFEGKYRDMNEMKFPYKTLVSMNMNEGDEIIIYKKD